MISFNTITPLSSHHPTKFAPVLMYVRVLYCSRHNHSIVLCETPLFGGLGRHQKVKHAGEDGEKLESQPGAPRSRGPQPEQEQEQKP